MDESETTTKTQVPNHYCQQLCLILNFFISPDAKDTMLIQLTYFQIFKYKKIYFFLLFLDGFISKLTSCNTDGYSSKNVTGMLSIWGGGKRKMDKYICQIKAPIVKCLYVAKYV